MSRGAASLTLFGLDRFRITLEACAFQLAMKWKTIPATGITKDQTTLTAVMFSAKQREGRLAAMTLVATLIRLPEACSTLSLMYTSIAIIKTIGLESWCCAAAGF